MSIQRGLILLLFVLFGGVMSLTGCATAKLPNNLAGAITNNDDLETVKTGLPSYLLMIDALVATYPDSENLLLTAATLNSSYAGVFIEVEHLNRRQQMSQKALNYAFAAFCAHDKKACAIKDTQPQDLPNLLSQWQNEKDLPFLYTLGTSWAGYIQNHSNDWLAIAQLGQAEAVLQQSVSIDESYEKGTALLYLGVMNSILPPSLGGKPEVAQRYYERALSVSNGENLIIPVYYASQYARLVFDRELHDRLLQAALIADPYVENLTLQNIYAQQLARELLDSANDYF